ncbi:cyclin-dependent kinase inhibitor 1-like isoform X1 [Xyrauchen texanus]|uniref:cyclin-dependent kinase inhibitor 1-like isoform X1 n=2 Tax=Xyrauchen texanus TaxID=154827 RepID=UPI002241F249|nr:cyclin-dependent kinase inhibitor 1-like isoform X1 [Xyrauchen texanus]
MTAQRRRQLRTMSSHKRILRALGNGSTRRSLFGPVDHEQLQAEYRDALRKDLEDATRRWSFDFISEKPLEGGDFQWEGVSRVRVPVLYRSCQTEELSRPRGESSCDGLTDPTGVGKENIPKTPEQFVSVPQDMEKTPDKNGALKRKQTNITDFYQAKKRLVDTPRKSGN